MGPAADGSHAGAAHPSATEPCDGAGHSLGVSGNDSTAAGLSGGQTAASGPAERPGEGLLEKPSMGSPVRLVQDCLSRSTRVFCSRLLLIQTEILFGKVHWVHPKPLQISCCRLSCAGLRGVQVMLLRQECRHASCSIIRSVYSHGLLFVSLLLS